MADGTDMATLQSQGVKLTVEQAELGAKYYKATATMSRAILLALFEGSAHTACGVPRFEDYAEDVLDIQSGCYHLLQWARMERKVFNLPLIVIDENSVLEFEPQYAVKKLTQKAADKLRHCSDEEAIEVWREVEELQASTHAMPKEQAKQVERILKRRREASGELTTHATTNGASGGTTRTRSSKTITIDESVKADTSQLVDLGTGEAATGDNTNGPDTGTEAAGLTNLPNMGNGDAPDEYAAEDDLADLSNDAETQELIADAILTDEQRMFRDICGLLGVAVGAYKIMCAEVPGILKNYCQVNNLTPVGFADKCGLRGETLKKIFVGESQLSIEQAEKLLVFFNCDKGKK
jgi:hypothetical protein